MLPQVDEEVIVGFEHGDTRRPIVLGSLFNGKDKPGAELEQNKDGSFGLVSNEKAFIHTKKDFEIKSDQAMKIEITKDATTVVDGGGSADVVSDRVAQLRREIDVTDSQWDKEKLQERLAKLSGGIAVIHVGAHTEVEMKERKHRIEDAVSATKAAVDEGIVAGGGSALVVAGAVLAGELGAEGDERTGVRVVARSLSSPLRAIADNAGLSGSVVAAHQVDQPVGHGYDAANEQWVDLRKAGIVDPVKVTRSALENAASIAALVLTTEALVVEKPEQQSADAAGSHGSHGHSHGPGGHHH
jgi:chaperonin GroEL